MNKFFVTLVALATLGFALPMGTAQECTPTTSQPEVDTGEGPRQFYVDHDPEQTLSIWVYEETNGIKGLQRGDEVKDDTCGGQIPADFFHI